MTNKDKGLTAVELAEKMIKEEESLPATYEGHGAMIALEKFISRFKNK